MSNSPIWVLNPSTGREIDVAPLLQALDQFDAPVNAPVNTGVLAVLQRTIRTLNVTVHDPQINRPIDIANLYRDLHQLEDMLRGLIEKGADT